MGARKKEQFVVVEARTAKGKAKMSYHGEKWEYRGDVDNMQFYRRQGPSIVVRSQDGSQVLFIRKQDDPDFTYRMV
jgi:membrane protein implicated in regulation of membrane protease activity